MGRTKQPSKREKRKQRRDTLTPQPATAQLCRYHRISRAGSAGLFIWPDGECEAALDVCSVLYRFPRHPHDSKWLRKLWQKQEGCCAITGHRFVCNSDVFDLGIDADTYGAAFSLHHNARLVIAPIAIHRRHLGCKRPSIVRPKAAALLGSRLVRILVDELFDRLEQSNEFANLPVGLTWQDRQTHIAGTSNAFLIANMTLPRPGFRRAHTDNHYEELPSLNVFLINDSVLRVAYSYYSPYGKEPYHEDFSLMQPTVFADVIAAMYRQMLAIYQQVDRSADRVRATAGCLSLKKLSLNGNFNQLQSELEGAIVQ
jgi:hypothetical protein